MMHLWLPLLVLLFTSPAWAATRLAVPSGGATTGTCTSTACTLARAISQAVAGDTISLADGTYTGAQTINCNSGAVDGTASNRITLRATNERQAHLSGSGATALQVYNCDYWTFEGLHISNVDNGATVASAPGSGMWIQDSHNLILRRLLVHNNNRYNNSHMIEFFQANDNLVEECEIYNFHRHGIIIQHGTRNTFRRNYAHSRNFANLPNCNTSQNGTNPYCSNDGERGDSALMAYPASFTIMENNIVENAQFGLDMNARFGASEGNKYYGNISRNNRFGFSLTAGSDNHDVSDMPLNSIFQDNIAINPEIYGFRLRSTKNAQSNRNTVIGPVGSSAWYTDLDPNGPGDSAPTSFVTNLLITHTSSQSAQGLNISGQSSFTVNFANLFNFPNNTPALTNANITNETTVNPQLGACQAWLPDASPMKGAGLAGSDIGASVLYRYQNGSLTSTPLWDPNSGKFPCGAAVPGVNDIAGSSCFDVNVRLNVGTGTCSFPAGYGGPPAPPTGNVARYTFEEGTGTSAADSSGQGHTLTLTSPGWGPPIIGQFSFLGNGARSGSALLTSDLKPATNVGLAAWWNGTTAAHCDVLSLGDSVVLRVLSSGNIIAFYFDGSAWRSVVSSPVNVLDGGNHLLWMTKSATALRLGVDVAQLGSTSLTGLPTTIVYNQGTNLVVGAHGNGSASFTCNGRIDDVYVWDTELTTEMIQNIYDSHVPVTGLSVTHMAWYAANAAQGNQLGSTDTDRSHPLTTPIGVRWAIHKGDTGSLTEYFRPFARVLSSTGAVLVDWTEITNSFGTLGVRYLQDSAISQGDATSVLLPLDGFTGIAGKVLENPIDLTVPYDAVQRITLSQGQHVELEIRVEFGPPLVPGQQVEIRPQRENGSPFDSYADKIYGLQFPGVDMLLPQNFSPVIDAVSCLGAVTTDMRGVARPQGADCDIGAYEMPSPGLVAGRQGGTYAGGTLR